MSFNPYSLKQGTEAHFSEKSDVIVHPGLVFNNNIDHKAFSQMDLVLYLMINWNSRNTLTKTFVKLKKGIGILSCSTSYKLLTKHKTFIRTHLDYG